MFTISPFRFWMILALILLFPLSMNWRLFMRGKLSEGTVVNRLEMPEWMEQPSEWPFFPVVEYFAEGLRYEAEPPENVKYREGRNIKVLYNREKPGQCMLLCFSGIFLDIETAGSGIALVLWLAFFHSFGKFKKPTTLSEAGPFNMPGAARKEPPKLGSK